MNWNLEGSCVEALYLDEIPVCGEVVLSRVAYGGRINHHVRLDSGFNAFCDKVRREAGEVVIVEHHNVNRVMGAH